MESLKTHLFVYEMAKVAVAAEENRTELTIRCSGSLHCPLVSGACEDPHNNTMKQFLHKTFTEMSYPVCDTHTCYSTTGL